jgi:hypothetical protein
LDHRTSTCSPAVKFHDWGAISVGVCGAKASALYVAVIEDVPSVISRVCAPVKFPLKSNAGL